MRSVVVTGASTGIGRSCALRLVRKGWRVFAGVRSDSAASALREAASEPGSAPRIGELIPVMLDVTDRDAIAAMAEAVRTVVGEGGLHGLVNNAGIATGGVLEYLDLDQLRHVLDVNVVGQLAVTQPLIPLLRTARGRIVMMSSISGRSALPMLGPYAASKHALEALVDALRLELHPWGIHVASVQPGTIDTPIWTKALAFAEEAIPTYPPRAMSLYGPLIETLMNGLRRMKGTPAEAVADAVVHALDAAKPRTRYVIGRDARIRTWIERLPDRMRDRVLLRRLPSYGR